MKREFQFFFGRMFSNALTDKQDNSQNSECLSKAFADSIDTTKNKSNYCNSLK